MKVFRAWLVCCFLLPIRVDIHARQPVITSEYAYRHYTTDDGLPSYALETLYQDSRGFIWVGCATGIARYDGFAFHRYMEGRFSNVSRVSENSRGEVCAYGFRLYTLDRQADTIRSRALPEGYYSFSNNHSALPIRYAVLNAELSDRKALFQPVDTGWVKLLEHAEFEKTDLFGGRVFVDETERLLYVPAAEGISVLTFDGRQEGSYPGYLARGFVRHEGAVWFITDDGIYRFRGRDIEQVKSVALNPQAMSMKCCSAPGGNLLFCDDLAVYRLAKGKVEKVFGGVNKITDMLLDDEGNLWVATYQGLYNLFRLQFKNHWLQNRSDVVRCVVVAENNDKIAGSFNGKLIHFNENGSREIPCPDNEHGYFFGAYGAEKDGAVFLPGAGRILCLKNGETRWLNLPVESYLFVQALPSGKLAAGGREAVFLFTPEGKIISRFSNDTLLQDIHSKIVEDRQGNLWCGGGKGITFIGNSTIKRMGGKNLSPCLTLVNDRRGDVWLTVENSLYKALNDTVKRMHTFPESIESIFFTRGGKLVVGTQRSMYLADENLAVITRYNHLNGFTGKEVMRADMQEDKDGTVWMPSITCLVSFHPDELITRQPKPKLYILSAFSSTDNVRWIKQHPDSLKLNYRNSNLRFSYIGLSYSQAQNVRYQYRLTGFQDEWSQPVDEREVTFNNLPPGRYTFELKADAGMDGTETAVLSLPIYIRPAYWQTWLFRIILFVALVGLIAFLVFRYLKLRHEREIRKANREKEMNELRVQSVRLKSIPHFNSNVLAGIEYFIMTKSKEEANELLTTYSRFTNITLHDIDKAQRSLKDELNYVRMYLELEKMRYGDKLSYTIETDAGVDENIMIPNMVIHTFAENAIKHGIRGKNAAGKVRIMVSSENNGIRISVEDDGVGRAESAKRNAEQRRRGHGLNILWRQIELYNQQNEENIEENIVDLTDSKGHPAGTRFELYVPYGYRYV